MANPQIDISEKSISKCEVAQVKFDANKPAEPAILISVEVPVGYAGTEIVLSRNELLTMIDALNGEW